MLRNVCVASSNRENISRPVGVSPANDVATDGDAMGSSGSSDWPTTVWPKPRDRTAIERCVQGTHRSSVRPRWRSRSGVPLTLSQCGATVAADDTGPRHLRRGPPAASLAGDGATGHTLLRTQDDPNTLVIVNDFPSADGARAFKADPTLADAMSRGGVDSAPEVWLCEEVETQDYR